MTTDADYWNLAREILTPRQLEVLELKHRHGMALRPIAFHLGVSVGSVRDALARAEQKMALELQRRYFDTDTAA